jgi:hypothetical protein
MAGAPEGPQDLISCQTSQPWELGSVGLLQKGSDSQR